ncbi:MAG: hypothetical protein NVSMB59_00080 [Vulcanimicrobiaceae bacterium]
MPAVSVTPRVARATLAFIVTLGLGTASAGRSPASAGAASPAPPDATALLRSSIDAPRTTSYIGQVETIRFSSSRALATIVKIEHRAPGLTRRWYVAPEALFGNYVITRPNATYEFETRRRRVVLSHPTLENPVTTAGSLDRMLANYRALVEGSDVIASRAATSLVLVNRYTGERAMRVWIDRETHLVLKKEEYHANGSVAALTRFDAVRYTNEIPASIFSVDVPADYTQVPGPEVGPMDTDVVRVIGLAGFRPYEPRNLPQGFTMTSGDVSAVNGVKTLHLLYSDGLRSISLFENATGAAADFGALRPTAVPFEGHEAQYVEDGPTTLLTWKEKSLHFALVGDLLRNELVEIAKSVVPN